MLAEGGMQTEGRAHVHPSGEGCTVSERTSHLEAHGRGKALPAGEAWTHGWSWPCFKLATALGVLNSFTHLPIVADVTLSA